MATEYRPWLKATLWWIPFGALIMALVLTAHARAEWRTAGFVAARGVIAGVALGIFVLRFTRRFPWPNQFGIRFAALNAVAAVVYSVLWVVLNSVLESMLRGTLVVVVGVGIGAYFVLGLLVYVMLAGILYATQATERAAVAEAASARSTLAALRAQLHPHFLFNTLHTVVQLIPRQPQLAAQSAQQLADLLRHVLEHEGDLVSLAEERTFVERYLDIERLRFSDRLRVHVDIAKDAESLMVPSFALLTLVENAVRHGVEPKVDPTDVTIEARVANGTLTIGVRDNGAGATEERLQNAEGTGLRRLRDRLRVLFGAAGSLVVSGSPSQGVTALLRLPATVAE